MTILVTGAAGFIGLHVSRRLLEDGQEIYGIDDLNDYYSVDLKCDRLAQLKNSSNFTFQKLDLNDRSGVETLFAKNSFTHVIHLAAQAGVRYSLQNPYAYADGNLSGFLHVLEGCRHSSNLKHLIFASSSSVYGANTKVPFSTQDSVDHPVSLYAATKKANELMAHAYSHLYDFPVTGLRFFTVYGPWGRPDMAYFKFVDAIVHDRPIEVYNQGKMRRDFTYIDDVVEGIIRLLNHIPSKSSTDGDINSNARYKIYNLGNNQPVELMKFIEVIEQAIGKSAEKIMKPMQSGDVVATYADINDLMEDVNFKPRTSVEEGVQKFVEWYLSYHQKDR
jgi:UDP-glucuronate 4-epimerase